MSRVLIINYPNMQSGGIETFLAYLMKYSIEQEIRVIWITSSYLYPLASYKDIVDYGKVETVIQHPWEVNFMVQPKIKVTSDSEVVMLSTTPLGYICFENYRNILNIKSFCHLLLVPNFEGAQYFPDQYFKSKLFNNYVYKFTATSVKKIDKNDGLRAFSIKHLDTYEKYFHFTIAEKERKKLASVKPDLEISEAEIQERAESRKQEFRIVTCSRFEFPHKGYLLGLLKEFERLKEKHPEVSLVIIGYGEGKKVMDEVISSFPSNIADSISFTGMLSNAQTVEEFRKSNLFIGLAGASGDAARCALPALIARHWSYSCETYGFYSDAYSKTLSTDPGEELLPYIEKVIRMNDSEYIELSKKQKDSIIAKRNYNPGYVFEQGSQTVVFTKREIRRAYLINVLHQIKHYADAAFSNVKNHFVKD